MAPAVKAATAHSGTKEKILEIALRHFQRCGYAGTSIRDIAEELGVSKAAVYYHFRAKGDLVDGLMGPVVAQVTGVLEGEVDAATAAGREHFLRRFVEILARYAPRVGPVMHDPAIREHLQHRVDSSGMPERVVAWLSDGLLAEGRTLDRDAAQLRAACAMGCPPAALQAWVGQHPEEPSMDQASQDLIVDCMLRVLGDR